ncbi:MAG TPA: hypothetical protein VHK90_13195, partial [Thermoanaerobaculia bacterium]|nr:hypothetical protein [Thermoanaerobaculia bacterium]
SPPSTFRWAEARRSTAAWFAVYFLAALLPRLSTLVSGTVFADDLVHLPGGHLLSYRFLNYIELALWQWVFGPDYLLTIVPKIIAAFYTAGLCSVLRAMLRAWSGSRSVPASALALLIPLHPLWNSFISWNVTGVYVLSLLLVAAGYALLEKHPAAGIVVIALGISGYQVHVGLLVPLLYAEAVLRKPPLVRRVLQCGAAVAMYLIATQIAALAGLQTWGDRGLALQRTLKPITNNLAVITQPLLAFYGGVELAWKYWEVPFLVLALVALTARPRVFAVAPIVLPTAAAAVLLATNAPATGPRVAAAIWIATLLAAIHSRAATIALAVFTMLLLPVTLVDAENRTRAWRADQAILARVPPGAEVAAVRGGGEPEVPPEWRTRPIVLEPFAVVTPFEYSNIRVQPEWFFTRYGRKFVPPRPGVPTIDSTTLQWRSTPTPRAAPPSETPASRTAPTRAAARE